MPWANKLFFKDHSRVQLSLFVNTLVVERKNLIVMENHQDIEFFVFGHDLFLFADLFARADINPHVLIRVVRLQPAIFDSLVYLVGERLINGIGVERGLIFIPADGNVACYVCLACETPSLIKQLT